LNDHFEHQWKDVQVDADPSTPILWALRDNLNMTGTKFGCGMALCGACTVHLAGQPSARA
jgi:isoquinoline 1-oxidoreductase alpha subunit